MVDGRTVLGPEPFVQSIGDYITSIHSRHGLSLDRMSVSAARKFDLAMRSSVASFAVDNLIELRIETRVTWGRASHSDERHAASITS